MSKVWFTSDLHLGHHKVAGLRGFTDVSDHDAVLFDNWTQLVNPGDQVWVLGDIAVSSPDYALYLLGAMPGHKHLISGNHDNVHPMHRDSHKSLKKHGWLDVFESVQPFARRRINGKSVLLSHFPYSADRGEARYPQYRLPDLGEYLLHGHTHLSEVRTSDHEIHVGLDAWDLRPVPLEVIEEFIQ